MACRVRKYAIPCSRYRSRKEGLPTGGSPVGSRLLPAQGVRNLAGNTIETGICESIPFS
jgi:hypothetical protein